MAENFFTDNLDLQHQLEKLDLSEVVGILENGFSYCNQYPAAPRNYADAKDNYRLILSVLGDICANHVAPRAGEADEEGAQFSDGKVCYTAATQEALALLRQADLMGAMLPWEYGGLNLPESIFQMMAEIVSRADAGLMTIFGLQEISATIAEYGDEEMKQRTLPRFAHGEVTGAMVLTEPDAGSDLGSVQTRAIYDEESGEWRLNGVKRFITNGCADILLVLARSEEDSTDARGLSLFEVEADETVRVRRIEHKMGINASPTCEVQFDNTPARLVGKQRFGLIRYAMAMMNSARLAIAAQALGIAEAAYEASVEYAREREAFGQKIGQFQMIQQKLADMKIRIEASRLLIYQAALAKDEARETGKRYTLESCMAKTFASETAMWVTTQAIQIHAGMGYSKELPIERYFRDAKVTEIYEGTSEIQRMVIARTETGLR